MMQPMPLPPMPEEEKPGLFGQLAGHPLFNMGLGVLAANTGHGGQFAPAFGQGALAGMQNYQMQQRTAIEQRRLQEAQRLARYRLQNEAQSVAAVEEFIQKLPPEQQALARVNPDEFSKMMLKRQMGEPEKPIKRFEYTKEGILDTITGEIKPLPGGKLGVPAGYKLDDDVRDLWSLDPEKAVTVQEARNKDRTAGVTEQGVLRKEYNQTVDEYRTIEKAAKVLPDLLTASETRNSKVSDLALIVQLAKAMDPTSVVREGEVYTIQRTGGMFDTLASTLNYVQNKGQLTTAMRRDLAETVMSYYRAALDSAKKSRSRYGSIAERYRIDPELIVGPDFDELRLPGAIPPPPPGFGTRVR